MKRGILMAIIFTAACIVSSAVVYAGHTLDATGTANLHPIDGSGIHGEINFVDDGVTLEVEGTASGLDPTQSYVSLIYDIGSSPEECEPTIFDPEDPNFILFTMCIGVWVVDEDGNGELEAINTNDGADYVPLSNIGTISIRELNPGEGGPVGTCGAPDEHVPLVACGKVSVHPGN